MKILGFYNSGEPGIEELLDVRLRYFSLLDECHWDIGIE